MSTVRTLQQLSERLSLHRKTSVSKPAFCIAGSDFVQAALKSFHEIGQRLAVAAAHKYL